MTLTGQSARQTLFLPNGMAPQATPKRAARSGAIKKAVFIGSGHLPNVDAARTIVEQIAPSVPEIEFHVVGDCLPPDNYPSNVVRHGSINNSLKATIMADADIAINPMSSGSGSNLKIFEFFENRLPIFSTSFGMRGVKATDGIHFVKTEIADFPDVLKRWMNERTRLEQIADEGHGLAVEQYNWRVIASIYADRLTGLTRPDRRQIDDNYVLALNDYDSFSTIGGGATRTVGLYRALAELSSVVFVCFDNGNELRVETVSDRIAVVKVPKTANHQSNEKYFDEKFYVSVRDILVFREATQNPYMVSVFQALRRHARTIVVEHPFMVGLPDMFCDRFVYSSQNNETDLKRRMLQYHPDRDALIKDVEEAESIAVKDSIGIIAVSDEDAASFVAGRARSGPVEVIRNGSGASRPVADEHRALAKERVQRRSVIFVGSGHIPNVEAGNFIVQNLARACPDIQFHLIGGVCASQPRLLPGNLVAWGVVDEGQKIAVMEKCRFAINPVNSGSGSNVKLADYLSNGLCTLTTQFGMRGYPSLARQHVRIAEQADFASALNDIIDDETLFDAAAVSAWKAAFGDLFAMGTIAKRFVKLLKEWEKPKARVLFVTYRYTSPPLGGAEAHLLNLLSGLSDTDDFAIDVVCSEVTTVHDDHRFAGRYEHEAHVGAPTGLRNIRYARFPLDNVENENDWEALRSAWSAQSSFEEAWFTRLPPHLKTSGLAWGWGYPESDGKAQAIRYMFRSAGLHLASETTVTIRGRAVACAVLMAQSQDGIIIFHEEISDRVELKFEAGPGAVKFTCSQSAPIGGDPRPLALRVEDILFDGVRLDLSQPGLLSVAPFAAAERFEALADAARESRSVAAIRLTDIRGPHSSALENYLEHSIEMHTIWSSRITAYSGLRSLQSRPRTGTTCRSS